jgi:hypothetical protein
VRARLAALLVVAGAVLLPVSLSLNWFSLSLGFRGTTVVSSATGWQILETLDAFLVVVTLVVFAWVLAPRLGFRRMSGRITIAMGCTAAGAIAFQLLDPPVLMTFYEKAGAFNAEVTTETGAWLALGGALLIAVGGALYVEVE